jgi:uncharacterized membrane protein
MEARTAGVRSGTQDRVSRPSFARRLTTETKQAFKTTEFWAMLGAIVAILIAGAVDDGLGARNAWLYVTIVAAAYMINRGLAKSGSSEPRTEELQHDGR